jgi:hypothetical protein
MTASPTKLPAAEGAALMLTTAALLEQGRALNGLSRFLTAGALMLLLLLAFFASQMPFGPSAMMAVALALTALLGLAELYFAFRVGFDAALFRRLATEPGPAGLEALDASLEELGLRPAAAGARPIGARPIDDRIRGARKLLRRQALCLALQLATIIVAAAFLALR